MLHEVCVPGAYLVTFVAKVRESRFDVTPIVFCPEAHKVALVETYETTSYHVAETELSLPDEVPTDTLGSRGKHEISGVAGCVTKVETKEKMESAVLVGTVLNKPSVKSVSDSDKFDGSCTTFHGKERETSVFSFACCSRGAGNAMERKPWNVGPPITGDT